MERGELYDELTPQLVTARKRCASVVSRLIMLVRMKKMQYCTNICGSNDPSKSTTDSTVVENSGYAVYNEICDQQLCTF